MTLWFSFVFYWRVLAIQCRASFCCTTELISRARTHSPSFSDFLPTGHQGPEWGVRRPEGSHCLSISYTVVYIRPSGLFVSLPPHTVSSAVSSASMY